MSIASGLGRWLNHNDHHWPSQALTLLTFFFLNVSPPSPPLFSFHLGLLSWSSNVLIAHGQFNYAITVTVKQSESHWPVSEKEKIANEAEIQKLGWDSQGQGNTQKISTGKETTRDWRDKESGEFRLNFRNNFKCLWVEQIGTTQGPTKRRRGVWLCSGVCVCVCSDACMCRFCLN